MFDALNHPTFGEPFATVSASNMGTFLRCFQANPTWVEDILVIFLKSLAALLQSAFVANERQSSTIVAKEKPFTPNQAHASQAWTGARLLPPNWAPHES